MAYNILILGASYGSLLGTKLLMAGAAALVVIVLFQLVTLPVEFDASFGRALPILREGQYISKSDYRAARRILTACALTYLASSLSGMLNFWRWLKMFRR